MVKAKMKAKFVAAPEQVWEVLINDLHVNKLASEEPSLPEEGETYSIMGTDGQPVSFTILESKPYERYEMKMEHAIFSGTWLAELSVTPRGGTKLTLTENMRVSTLGKRILNALFINRRQRAYVRSVYRKLGDRMPIWMQ